MPTDSVKDSIRVHSISWFQYMIDFGEYRNLFFEHSVLTVEEDMLILGAYDPSGSSKGILIFTEMDSIVVVNYLKTFQNDYDIRFRLLEECVGYSEEKGKSIEFACLSQSDSGIFVHEELMEPLGFRLKSQYFDFSTRLTDEVKDSILLYGKRLVPVVERWKQKGFYLKSFEKLSEAELNYIKENPEGTFDNSLNAGEAIEDTKFPFAPELSFAVLKEGKVCAYSIFGKLPGGICRYRIRQAAGKSGTSGLSAYCTQASLEQMIKDGYKEIQGIVFSENKNGLPIILNRSHFRSEIQSLVEKKIYVKRKEEKSCH